jgi:hypothetical protein
MRCPGATDASRRTAPDEHSTQNLNNRLGCLAFEVVVNGWCVQARKINENKTL